MHSNPRTRRLATATAALIIAATLGLGTIGGPAAALAAPAKGRDRVTHSNSRKVRRASVGHTRVHYGHATATGSGSRHRIHHEVVKSGGRGGSGGSSSGSGSSGGGSGSTTTGSGSGSTTTVGTPEAPVEVPSTIETPAAPETPSTPETPTVEPPTIETPSTAGLLFDGTSIKDYTVQAAPHAITEVPDPAGSGQTVFDMTVHNEDVAPITPTENPRAQALSPAIVEPGHEYWLETKFFIPTGMPYVSGWMSLVSIYGPPFAGSSPWQIGIYEHEVRWMRNFAHDNDIPWKEPLAEAEGRWTTILMHNKFATEGFVEMWVNGKQITFFPKGNRNPNHEPETTHLAMATMDSSNDGGPNSAKIMQYRMLNMFETASVYFGPLKLGLTRASVEA